jgi:hypothetical protein
MYGIRRLAHILLYNCRRLILEGDTDSFTTRN